MATVHEMFERRGVYYSEIHFQVTPYVRDLIIRRFRDGVEIGREEYSAAKAEYMRLLTDG